MNDRAQTLSVLSHPYSSLTQFTDKTPDPRADGKEPGSALVWFLAHGDYRAAEARVAERPGGLSLIVILPVRETIACDPNLMHAIQRVRPHGILPYQSSPDPSDLAQVLRRPPIDLAGDVVDYVRWRGLHVDRDTAHVIRKIIDLSEHLHSVSAISRSMYLSRRALGRRLMSRELPVPSHWLQLARLLRVSTRLQNSDASVASIAHELGYPDGFSVSNQMERVLGCRPSTVRERLGWEWLVEAWLIRETGRGPRRRESKDVPTRRRIVRAGAGESDEAVAGKQ